MRASLIAGLFAALVAVTPALAQDVIANRTPGGREEADPRRNDPATARWCQTVGTGYLNSFCPQYDPDYDRRRTIIASNPDDARVYVPRTNGYRGLPAAQARALAERYRQMNQGYYPRTFNEVGRGSVPAYRAGPQDAYVGRNFGLGRYERGRGFKSPYAGRGVVNRTRTTQRGATRAPMPRIRRQAARYAKTLFS